MKTLKINVPDGYEIDKEQSTFEKIVFKEIKKGLPKCWEELEKLQGFYTDSDSNVRYSSTNRTTYNNNRNIFATKQQAEASIALAQLSQLREVYRQGWVPDWSNPNEVKYVFEFSPNGIYINRWYSINTFLSFQSKEIAEQFLKNFRNLIEKAKPLMS
jgi:hypothetical protein